MNKDQRLCIIKQTISNFIEDEFCGTYGIDEYKLKNLAGDLHHALFSHYIDESNIPDNAIEAHRGFMRDYGKMKG